MITPTIIRIPPTIVLGTHNVSSPWSDVLASEFCDIQKREASYCSISCLYKASFNVVRAIQSGRPRDLRSKTDSV